jgi:manganese/zinc/iron transport system permease protein
VIAATPMILGAMGAGEPALVVPQLLAAVLAACLCGLLGNFLVLRRMSMLGDAISHAILPGIVVSFLLLGSRSTPAMLAGALAAGVVGVLLIELVRRVARIEGGAAMGVVFSGLFALGVLLMERAARNVDLDAGCVLYGNLEGILWLSLDRWSDLLRPAAWGAAPRQVVALGVMLALSAGLVVVFFKHLRLACFDPGLADALGFPSWIVHTALAVLVAAAAVGAFEAVGSILVIAMLVCPAVTARQLTDRLIAQVWLSLGISVVTAVGGYALAVWGPGWVGWGASVSAPGMMTVLAGVLLVTAIIVSPGRGVVARWVRRRRLGVEMAREDVLAALYRRGEGATAWGELVPAGRAGARGARDALRRGLVTGDPRRAESLALTRAGQEAAREVVRSHRLWETYLVHEAGQRPDHVHDAAMALEHLRDEQSGQRLSGQIPPSPTDPQQKPIP